MCTSACRAVGTRGRVEPAAQLRARLRAVRLQRLRDDVDAALRLRHAHTFLPEAALVPGRELGVVSGWSHQ